MPTTIKNLYGANNQTIAITLASLANNGQRQSTVIDNTANLFLDALVQVTVRSAASSTSSTGACNLYAFGTSDGGTTYSDGAGASDAAITLTSPPNMRLVGIINVVANSTTYKAGPFSVAQAFGGVLPALWGIVVENKTSAVLDGSAGNFVVDYQGIQAQGV